jgi:hypothetical protein
LGLFVNASLSQPTSAFESLLNHSFDNAIEADRARPGAAGQNRRPISAIMYLGKSYCSINPHAQAVVSSALMQRSC